MTHEAWIIIICFALSNAIALVGGLVHISAKLARIEPDIKWRKAGCPKCQQTSENPSP